MLYNPGALQVAAQIGPFYQAYLGKCAEEAASRTVAAASVFVVNVLVNDRRHALEKVVTSRLWEKSQG